MWLFPDTQIHSTTGEKDIKGQGSFSVPRAIMVITMCSRDTGRKTAQVGAQSTSDGRMDERGFQAEKPRALEGKGNAKEQTWVSQSSLHKRLGKFFIRSWYLNTFLP